MDLFCIWIGQWPGGVVPLCHSVPLSATWGSENPKSVSDTESVSDTDSRFLGVSVAKSGTWWHTVAHE